MLIAVERAIVEKIQNDDIINNPTLIVIITIKFILYTAIKAVVRLGQAGRRSGALGTENLFSEKLFWLFKLSENINIYFTLRKSIACYFSSVFVFFKSWFWNFQLKRAPQKLRPGAHETVATPLTIIILVRIFIHSKSKDIMWVFTLINLNPINS